MIDHHLIKDLIDRVFIDSGNTPMTTSAIREIINRTHPDITTRQIWQTLNDFRFAGHYIKMLELSGRHLYQIEENCFLIILKVNKNDSAPLEKDED